MRIYTDNKRNENEDFEQREIFVYSVTDLLISDFVSTRP